MPASAEFLRMLVQGIAWDATDAGLPLESALKSAVRAKLSQSDRGAFLSGTTGNGKSVSFEIPALGRGMSPQEIAQAVFSLWEVFTVAKASLIEGGIAAPTDAQILAEIQYRCMSVRSVRPDFSTLRTGPQATESEIAA